MISKAEATKILLNRRYLSETESFIYAGPFIMRKNIMELDYPKKGKQADKEKLPNWSNAGVVYFTTKTLVRGEEEIWDIGCSARSASNRISSYRGDPNSKPKNEGDKGDGGSNLAMRKEVQTQEGKAVFRFYYLHIPSSLNKYIDLVTSREVSIIDRNAAIAAEKALTELFIELTGSRPEGQDQIG